MRVEIARRQHFADALEAHFTAHPYTWVSIMQLIQIGGPSWRSRIVEDLREKRSMDIPWNGDTRQSAYMYRPVAIGREPSQFIAGNPETWTLFDLHPSGWQR